MKNSQDEEAKENSIFNILVTIGGVGIVSIIVVFAVYCLHIIINENKWDGWVAFGDYFGGILSPILAFAALIALLYSIHYQVNEFQKSTKQLEESAIALKSQNELIQQQNLEAINFHSKEAEIKKIDATNEFLLETIDSLQELLAIKRNYIDKLENHPVQRASITPPVLTNTRPRNPKISKLIFLEKGVILPRKKFPGDIIFLSCILNDYNTIIEMLKVRSDLHIEISQKPSEDASLMHEFSKIDSRTHNFFIMAGKIRGVKLIHLTEELINFINRTLKHLYSIIKELPDIAESFISPDALKEYNKVLRYELNTKQDELLKKEVPVNKVLYEQIISKQYI